MTRTVSRRLGTHWIFDAQTTAGAGFLDAPTLREALVGLPRLLELTVVGEPQQFIHQDGAEQTLGGVVLLSQSHLSLHAFPDSGLLHGDLFSCKPFSVDAARRYLEALFRLRTFRENLLERGAF